MFKEETLAIAGGVWPYMPSDRSYAIVMSLATALGSSSGIMLNAPPVVLKNESFSMDVSGLVYFDLSPCVQGQLSWELSSEILVSADNTSFEVSIASTGYYPVTLRYSNIFGSWYLPNITWVKIIHFFHCFTDTPELVFFYRLLNK